MRQAAWNRHDAQAFAAVHADDADVVNVEGWWRQGRAALERNLRAAFASVFRQRTLTFARIVRFLPSGIAIAHARWVMSGARTPQGLARPTRGVQTLVLQKRGAEWRIAALQNTISVAERPFARQ